MNSETINNQSLYFLKALIFKERVQMKELHARLQFKVESTERVATERAVFILI